MGNKLANPEEITDEDIANYHSSTPVKKEHVLRLWVDLFNVKEDDSHEADLQWHKITEDVVPASITCISDDPNTIYHIRAYNSQVEKICDIKIVQPGTKLKQPTESFIHLKDAVTNKHWGFNFTSADDAAKFRDTCLTLSAPTVSKSTSFGSLRLPKKKWKTGSARDGRRSETLDGLSSISSGSNLRASSGRDIEGILTAPRFRQNQSARIDSRSLFANVLPAVPADTILESLPAPPEQSRPASHTLGLISEHDDSNESLANNELPHNPSTQPSSSEESVENLRNDENLEMPKPARLDMVEQNSRENSNSSNAEEEGSSCSSETSSSVDSEEFNKPATLSAAHLNAILYSCENIAHTTDKEQQSSVTQHDVISEEDEEADTTIIEEPTATVTLLSTTDGDGQQAALCNNTHSDSNVSQAALSSISNDLLSNNDSTLHKMLQSLPSNSTSNASFGIEAELGDPSITAPLPNTDSSRSLLRRASNRGQSATSIFRGSHRGKQSDDCQSLSSSNDKIFLEYEQKLRDQDMYEESQKTYDDHDASLYQDSGFGGTVSTNKSASVKSAKSKSSRRSSRVSSSEKSQSSLVTGSESVYSSSSSQRTKTSDVTTQVKPFTILTDQSDCDEEEDNSSTNSFTTQPAVIKSFSSLARQSGATRKTGWLEVKNWLMHSKKKLALANKRHWKRYWVTLRGTTLMFYSCDDQASLTEDALPKHMIYIDGSIAQSVPEHPKRENIFSVSSAYGDAYLFQAPTQFEHDTWITCIHSACASQHARQHGKTNPLKVLQSEIEKLQENIDSDSKMKKMAELQLSVVKEVKSRSAISKQIQTWEENLECLYMDQYRFKCYLSSLQASELPNPKYILSSMSRGTKQRLGKLGILSATSFHSLICIRTPNAYNTYIGQQQQKKGLLSTLRQNSSQSRLKVTADTFMPPAPGSDDGDESGNDDSEESAAPTETNGTDEMNSALGSKFGENLTRILLPNNQLTVVSTDEEMSVRDVLEIVCNKRQLVLSDCFLRIRTKDSTDYVTPGLDVVFDQLDYDRVEVCNKLIFQVDMSRTEQEMFGVVVEAELADDAETEDELKVFIEEVEDGSPAEIAGLIAGDELLTLNGQVVLELDIEHIDEILANQLQVCVTVRSCRLKRPESTIASALTNHADTYIDNMMCPPPPLQSRISNRIIDDLIVPAPSWVHNQPEEEEEQEGGETPLTPRGETEKSVTNIKDLLLNAEHVTHLCRMAHEKKVEDSHPVILPIIQPLTDAQKLRKIILELINTERAYVRDLSMLMERYLEPLKEETFLSSEEVVRLVGNIQEIVHFQREFLKNLEESVEDESFVLYTTANEFKRVLFSIAGSFIYYANHFKLYSSFCASHSRAQKVLSPGDNSELYEFLHARNPKQQHSATLESYLIKPIQRILKYPLLLNQLKSLTDSDSNEYTHLSDALKSMESVAEHINEMQKIYEEFGTVFDDLTRAHANKQSCHGADKRKLELNVGDLQYYGEADWLNAYNDISKSRKGCEHVTTIFVFKHGIVLLCQERLKGKPSKTKSNGSKLNTADNGGDTTYCKFLPVSEIQVRTLPTTHAGGPVALWELLHLKSATESRPEKIYHMACSNVDKRIEFLKYMRLIIRESVKKMTVPKAKVSDAESKLRHSAIDQLRHSALEPIRHSVTTDLQMDSNSARLPDNRYSMNLDCARLTIPDLDHQGGRSRTFGDLADLTDGDPLSIRNTSVNSVDSDASHGSARLVYSSQDPVAYSSKGSLDYADPSSPVWEKRSDDLTEGQVLGTPTNSAVNDNTRRTLKIHELYVSTATEC